MDQRILRFLAGRVNPFLRRAVSERDPQTDGRSGFRLSPADGVDYAPFGQSAPGGLRTPIGRFLGGLSAFTAVDLAVMAPEDAMRDVAAAIDPDRIGSAQRRRKERSCRT